MDEQTNHNEEIEQEVQPQTESAWYDSLVKLVQDVLNFNMITYKEEKTPRL